MNELPKRESRQGDPENNSIHPFFVTDHVRPAHCIFVPLGHRHQGSNRTEEAQVLPSSAAIRKSHGPKHQYVPVQRVAPRHPKRKHLKFGVTHQKTMTQPCLGEGGKQERGQWGVSFACVHSHTHTRNCTLSITRGVFFLVLSTFADSWIK